MRNLASAGRVIRGPDWSGLLRAQLAAPPGDTVAWMERHTRLLKRDAYSRAGLLNVRDQPCFLKLYLAKSSLQRLGFWLGYGRAVHSFDAAAALARAGVAVPAPRACLLVPEGMVLLTEGIAASRDLRALWPELPTEEQAGEYMLGAGEVLAALHHAGFAHGDCKWGNLLWAGGQFYLVDLEAVRQVHPAGAAPPRIHARQLRDLARFTLDGESLAVSPGQYQVFLASYCARSGRGKDEVIEAMRPGLEVLRRRHRDRYGTTPDPLV